MKRKSSGGNSVGKTGHVDIDQRIKQMALEELFRDNWAYIKIKWTFTDHTPNVADVVIGEPLR